MSKRILIFNVNWLGDVIFSTAAIRNIRYNFPDSFIACVVPKRCFSVLEGNIHLDEIIIFDESGEHRGIWGKVRFIRKLRLKHFDTAFLFHRSFTRAVILRLSGIKQLFGYYAKKRGFLLSRKIIAPDYDSMHRTDYYLQLLIGAGLMVRDRYPEFFIPERAINSVKTYLKKNSIGENDFVVAINPGGNWMPKRWPKENFSMLADMLIEKFRAFVVITGSENDKILAGQIAGKMKEKPFVACGVFDLKEFGAFLKRADVFVTADTGPLHIATACKAKKIIALFGPTSAEITGPYPGSNVIVLTGNADGCMVPCYSRNCQDNRCMKQITPERVFQEIIKGRSGA